MRELIMRSTPGYVGGRVYVTPGIWVAALLRLLMSGDCSPRELQERFPDVTAEQVAVLSQLAVDLAAVDHPDSE